ncbi:MAG: GNAT family N-acetyltransferase [Candidatus Levybacteria bacterium]|nr:GNAT family N-acetyltransferase [Candidatus Levybacteria bacterium]
MGVTINLHTISALKEIFVRGGIKLRPLRSSDAMRLLEILSDDSSIRDKVTVASRLHTPEDVIKEVKNYHKETGLIRYTLLKEDKPIGIVSLWRDEGYFGTAPQPDDYGFGFFLDPKERGKGLVTNALQCIMDTLVKNLHVNNFVVFCEDSNHESIAVLTKLGFGPTDKTFSEPYKGWLERKYVKPAA